MNPILSLILGNVPRRFAIAELFLVFLNKDLVGLVIMKFLEFVSLFQEIMFLLQIRKIFWVGI